MVGMLLRLQVDLAGSIVSALQGDTSNPAHATVGGRQDARPDAQRPSDAAAAARPDAQHPSAAARDSLGRASAGLSKGGVRPSVQGPDPAGPSKGGAGQGPDPAGPSKGGAGQGPDLAGPSKCPVQSITHMASGRDGGTAS